MLGLVVHRWMARVFEASSVWKFKQAPLLRGSELHFRKPPVSEPDREIHRAARWDQPPEGIAGLCPPAPRAKSVEACGGMWSDQLALWPLARREPLASDSSGSGGICGWTGREGGAAVGGLLNTVGVMEAAWADMRPMGWEIMYRGIREAMVGSDNRGGLYPLSQSRTGALRIRGGWVWHGKCGKSIVSEGTWYTDKHGGDVGALVENGKVQGDLLGMSADYSHSRNPPHARKAHGIRRVIPWCEPCGRAAKRAANPQGAEELRGRTPPASHPFRLKDPDRRNTDLTP